MVQLLIKLLSSALLQCDSISTIDHEVPNLELMALDRVTFHTVTVAGTDAIYQDLIGYSEVF